jgi:hypothetical protein
MFKKAALTPALPGIEFGNIRAPSPVWRNSTTSQVRFAPMTRKAAAKLWHEARRFERATRQRGLQDGALGRNGLAVLYVLLFDYLNYVTGQLDPAIDTIADKANISPRSAARGLANLKAAGILNWVRRCITEIGEAGRLVFRQLSNAYAVLPISQWIGWSKVTASPPPAPGTWGEHPPLPSMLKQAATEPTLAQKIAVLEMDAPNSLAAALAKLGHAVDKSLRPTVLPDCQPGNETLPESFIYGRSTT